MIDDEPNEKDGLLGRYRRYISISEMVGVPALLAVEQIRIDIHLRGHVILRTRYCNTTTVFLYSASSKPSQ